MKPALDDKVAEAEERIYTDPRVGAKAEYDSTDAALLDLNEHERIRYLYIERERIIYHGDRPGSDPAMIPTLRAISHDEAIVTVARAALGLPDSDEAIWEGQRPEVVA